MADILMLVPTPAKKYAFVRQCKAKLCARVNMTDFLSLREAKFHFNSAFAMSELP
jgi:hypothetical protein